MARAPTHRCIVAPKGYAAGAPDAGSRRTIAALIIGLVAGVLCQIAVGFVKSKLKIDDTLDVFAVHGVGGIFGTLMIIVFGGGSAVAQFGGVLVAGV